MYRDKAKNRANNISIVVLDGTNVLREKSGVEPLRYALNQEMKPDDQVVVLVIFNTSDMVYSPVVTSCCIAKDGRNDQPSERERYIRILREEISQGTEDYMKIFRPFYKECKSKRVKFMVKIVVGSTLDAIVTEEKNNIGATSVVIERNFAKEYAPWVTRKNNKPLSHIDDVKVLTYTCRPQGDVPAGSSSVQDAVYVTQSISRFKRKTFSHDEKLIYCTLPNFEGIYQPSTSSSSIETYHESSQEYENFEIVEETTTVTSSSTHELGFLIELSWEVISEITERFMNIIPVDSNEAFQMYRGFLQDQRSAVFVKRYVGIEYRYVLEAEKKAASTLYHKNILGLFAFHKNEAALALVFPDASRGAFMDRFLNDTGFWTRELKISFQVKMNIAIGIAQGLRYMHEQCPRGAVIHGDLRPCNILLGNNLEPQITGFGQAKWLQFDQSSPTRNSCGHMHPSDLNSLNLMKSDILGFGILLLRLFCTRSAPRDDKDFVRWARPLLAQRAYHILYDESEYDIHGLVVVTSAAARCFSTRLKSRPCMSKVLSYLKGEISCAEQTFPSTESSPNIASTPDLSLWEL